MNGWDAARVAEAAGASVIEGAAAGPSAATIDSRAVSGGELFVGLRGERVDGGEHAAEALRAGAWGVLVGPEHAEPARVAAGESAGAGTGAVLVHPGPLAALQALARAWRRELGASGAK